MTEQSVNLAIPDPEKFDTVLRQAKDAGLTVTEAAEELGIIVGTIAPDDLAKLNRIEGIAAIEPGRELSID